jgi:NAD(P)-dependent dehydrogenase (short-subunit alcohol dehydrogenase family)
LPQVGVLDAVDANPATWRMFMLPSEGGPPELYERLAQAQAVVRGYLSEALLGYFAALRIMLAVLPGMRKRRFGQIINVSSAGVQTKVPRFGAYIASKAALDTLSDAFQAETEDEGVRFTTVYMSLVRTPMISPTALYDQFPALSPEEAGEVICDAITARPRRISPAFGRLAAFADSVSPELMDAVRNRGFRIIGDSSAAQGTDAPGSGDALSSGRKVFRDLTPGVHW